MGKMPTSTEINPDAYALYLKGKHAIALGDFRGAIELLRSALKLQPDYAPGWVQLTWAYWSQVNNQEREVHEGMALARDAVERALVANDRFAEAYIALGWIQLDYEWDWPGANESMRRGLELAPGNSEVLDGAAILALSSGRVGESLELFRQALELNPLSLPTHFNFGTALLTAGRFEESADAFRKVLEIYPEARFAHTGIGLGLLLQHEPEAALEEMEAEVHPLSRDFGMALVRCSLGPPAEADRAVAAFIEQHAESAPFNAAALHAWRGDPDEAFAWLEVAFDQHASDLSTILSDPLMVSLRTDPRWTGFLDRLGAPH
jgi:tetratricopeptide (TPR) repeat protein